MTSVYRKQVRNLLLFFVFGSALLACNSVGTGFPQIASPPRFDYADGEELRSGMHQLAFELQRLDTVLMQELSGDVVTKEMVEDVLDNIERIASQLRDGDMTTRHSFLRNDMENFLNTIYFAQMGMEANPPRFYQAGRVSGACINCHRINS